MKLKFQRYYGDIARPAPRKTDRAGLLLLYTPFHAKNLGSGHVFTILPYLSGGVDVRNGYIHIASWRLSAVLVIVDSLDRRLHSVSTWLVAIFHSVYNESQIYLTV